MQLAHHPKIIYKYGILIHMLKQTELTVLQTQFDPIFEILICIYNTSLFIFSGDGVSVNYLDRDFHRLRLRIDLVNLDISIVVYGDLGL